MMDYIKKLKEFVADSIFTVKCPYCSCVIDRNSYVCKSCKEKFPDNIYIKYAVGGYICYSAFPYEKIFKNSVCCFKFNNCGAYSKLFAKVMYERLKTEINSMEFELVTCVPMHKNAVEKRGYNQAELLARDFAEIIGLPYVDTLEKYKENKTQHSIKKNERAKNVKGVYRITDKNLVENKRILLIDDIITTGNTLGECAKILSYANCGHIACVTLCAVQ